MTLASNYQLTLDRLVVSRWNCVNSMEPQKLNTNSYTIELRNGYLILGVLPSAMKIPVNGFMEDVRNVYTKKST